MHIDLKNVFLSFGLPPGARIIFQFRPGPGLPAVELERLPFGWKHRPYFCQTALARILQGVLPPGVMLVHYVDDLLLAYTEEGVLREASFAALCAQVEAGFLMSPNSVLHPVQLVSLLGKALNLASRTVACYTQALLHLWVGWMRLALGEGDGQQLCSYLGLLNWHVRPRGIGCPFGAVEWCLLRWGWTVDRERQPSQGPTY